MLKKKAEPEKNPESVVEVLVQSGKLCRPEKGGHDRQLHCILGNIFKAEEGSERYMCQLQRMETHRGDTAQDRSRRSHHCKRPLLAQQPDSPPGSSKMQLLND